MDLNRIRELSKQLGEAIEVKPNGDTVVSEEKLAEVYVANLPKGVSVETVQAVHAKEREIADQIREDIKKRAQAAFEK
jgi:hypothetical protein